MELVNQQDVITQEHINKGISYQEYRALIDQLLAEGKTTGENHSEKMIEYTELNVKRMSKWDKIFKVNDDLSEAIKSIDVKQTWLVITEAWCGDAAQNIPVINKLAELNDSIDLRFIFRDENLDVMDAYLTEGGRSIPKLIILDQELNELGTWGPRPQPVQVMLNAYKADESISYDEFANQAHLWYGKDRHSTSQQELLTTMQSLNVSV